MAVALMETGLAGRRPRLLATLAVAALALAVIAGFGGTLAPALDSLGHFRAHLAVLLALASLAALALRVRLVGALGLGVAAAALITVAPFLVPHRSGASASPSRSYSLLQMNVLYRAGDREAALRRVRDAQPDVVTLQEMTPEWRDALASLSDSYPYQFFCRWPGGPTSDAAILSRRPFAAGDRGTCDTMNALSARAVDFDGVAVTIASQHQLWPWPAGQWHRIAALRPTLAALPKPLIVGGDFNAAPWSAAVRTYAAAAGTRPVEGIGPTWFPEVLPAELGRWFGLPLDNVLASDGIAVLGSERLPATGSDHLPVLVRFTLAPPSPPPR